MDPLKLPIRQFTEEIVQSIRKNDTIVVIGETGSGKTTQISQVRQRPAPAASGLVPGGASTMADGHHELLAPVRSADPAGGGPRGPWHDRSDAAAPRGEQRPLPAAAPAHRHLAACSAAAPPRRPAAPAPPPPQGAVTVARRVAEERGCELGDEVGYCVRFEDRSSSRTKVKYLTGGGLAGLLSCWAAELLGC
jgi:ATP-dependent RNA helicase DHX8/PRP22